MESAPTVTRLPRLDVNLQEPDQLWWLSNPLDFKPCTSTILAPRTGSDHHDLGSFCRDPGGENYGTCSLQGKATRKQRKNYAGATADLNWIQTGIMRLTQCLKMPELRGDHTRALSVE